ncbi:MAG: DNA repair protein RecN [Acidobacteriota bacterium]
MLEELVVKNYALIDHLEVRFSPGLNILTGGTGAGKSILVGALGLVLGLKADPEAVRAGAEEIDVAGVVDLSGNPEGLAWLGEHAIAAEDHRVIIRRVVKRSGKGAMYVQGSPLTLTALKELTGTLFDLHGQHEHQSLLAPENHRRLLDHYGDLTSQVSAFAALYARLVSLREEHAALLADARDRQRRIELLRYSAQEIEGARLQPGEEENLKQEQTVLANYEKLVGLLEEIHSAAAESQGGGALGRLRQCRGWLAEAAAIDSQLTGLAKQLDNAYYELEDFAESLARHKNGVSFEAGRLEVVEERLALIRKLEKKYGGTVEGVLATQANNQKELAAIETSEAGQKRLETQITELERQVRQQAGEISQGRQRAATTLQQRIAEELKQLGMPKVGFQVEVADRTNDAGKPLYSPTGKDRVEFLISPNLGEPLKRLAQIASGGELSRIMLAIKSVLAESDYINTLIFDEVDAGIGGEVALAVGERLKKLARTRQVLCITHLATIAVRADNHIRVEKVTEGDRTVTRVGAVNGAARREEIARMLAGDRKGDTSLRHADELLKKYGG